MKIKWTKTIMNQDQASYGNKHGILWLSLDVDNMKFGYIFMDGQKVVTKHYKTKAAAKKAAEKWLKEKS